MWDLTHTSDCCGLAVERWPATREHLRAKWAHKKAEWDGLSRAGAPATRTAHTACHVQVHVHVCACVTGLACSVCERGGVACERRCGTCSSRRGRRGAPGERQESVPRRRLPGTRQHCMVTSDYRAGVVRACALTVCVAPPAACPGGGGWSGEAAAQAHLEQHVRDNIGDLVQGQCGDARVHSWVPVAILVGCGSAIAVLVVLLPLEHRLPCKGTLAL